MIDPDRSMKPLLSKCIQEAVHLALIAAHRAVGFAEAERGAVLTAARHNGLSLRTIANVIGVAPSTVMRWTDDGEDNAPDQEALLDEPAREVEGSSHAS